MIEFYLLIAIPILIIGLTMMAMNISNGQREPELSLVCRVIAVAPLWPLVLVGIVLYAIGRTAREGYLMMIPTERLTNQTNKGPFRTSVDEVGRG